MRKITSLILLVLSCFQLDAQSTRVQFIHNVPDPLADTVNIFVDGMPLITDFAFRSATPFLNVPAGVPLRVHILPQGLNDTNQAVLATTVSLAATQSYHIMAEGIVDTANFDSKQYLRLRSVTGAREQSSSSGQAELTVAHGSPDAGTVDVLENSIINTSLVNALAYGQNLSYQAVPAQNYSLLLTNNPQTIRFGEYSAPLATLMMSDSALMVMASGFADPSLNPGPALGLYAVTAGGSVIALPRSNAYLQVIHNSGDVLSTELVDVWVNNQPLLDSFAFRTATPYLAVPSQTDLRVSVLPINANDTALALAHRDLRLGTDSAYVAVATGIVSGAPFDSLKPFELVTHPARRQARLTGQTDILVYHGATDAPRVTVDEITVPLTPLIDSLSYGDFTGYLELPTLNYQLLVKNTFSGAHIARYSAPLASLGFSDSSLTLLASGFVDTLKFTLGDTTPTVVAKFGLYLALPSGGALVPLPVISDISLARNSSEALQYYPLPADDQLYLELDGLQRLEVKLYDLQGRLVSEQVMRGEAAVFRVSLSELPSGTYLMSLRGDGKSLGVHKLLRR